MQIALTSDIHRTKHLSSPLNICEPLASLFGWKRNEINLHWVHDAPLRHFKRGEMSAALAYRSDAIAGILLSPTGAENLGRGAIWPFAVMRYEADG